jgi:hypothetical protein
MATPAQIALLRARLKSGTSSGGLSDTELGLLYDQADELVRQYCKGPDDEDYYTRVPEATATRCTLDAADRLHALEVAPSGQAQYDTLDATPIGISRDPLIAVYPIIDRYLPGGFA